MTIPALDRAALLRRDTDRLERALDDGENLLAVVWRGNNLVQSDPTPRAALVQLAASGRCLDLADELVWLGKLGERDCFAVDLSSHEEKNLPPELTVAGQLADLRYLALLPAHEFELLALAKGLLHWHRNTRFCGRCGAETRPREGGYVRECPREGEKLFPRTDPAIMLAIEHDGRLLLARQPQFPPGMYSVLAGFVEPGETLEQAAAREALEEVGLPVTEITYHRSQAWPFPQSLMIGFVGQAAHPNFSLDDEELEHARWVTREELREPKDFLYPPPTSLAYHMLMRFLAG